MLVIIKCNKTFKLTIFKDRDHWRYLLDKYLISNNFTTAYYKVFPGVSSGVIFVSYDFFAISFSKL